MWQNAHDAYLENRVLSAEPLELVHLMYQAATNAVRDARRHLAAGEICERSRAITKASEIVIELASSLDYERGGEISRGLCRLYEFMMGKLVEANIEQCDAPLAEVLGLLTTLSEAWSGVKTQETPADRVPEESRWAQPGLPEPAAAGRRAGACRQLPRRCRARPHWAARVAYRARRSLRAGTNP